MKIQIESVKNNGELLRERVILKASSNINIGMYMICDTTYNDDNTISNKLRNTYWFPDKNVKIGDFVVLYTGIGTDSQYRNRAGTVTHTFYWGLGKTVWNKDRDTAVLFEISDWAMRKVFSQE